MRRRRLPVVAVDGRWLLGLAIRGVRVSCSDIQGFVVILVYVPGIQQYQLVGYGMGPANTFTPVEYGFQDGNGYGKGYCDFRGLGRGNGYLLSSLYGYTMFLLEAPQ